MTTPAVMMATWSDGLFVLSPGSVHQEFAGRSVRGLRRDQRGGVIAIVDRRTVYRRAADGAWRIAATSPADLASCVEVGDAIYAGTDDARMLRIDAGGQCEPLAGFEAVAGRDKWYAGTAIVDGRVMGPPLGVRSMTATCDGAALLVNVHVGGIPRSTDRGKTWQPTIDIEVDVHEVAAHPTRPELAIAAGGLGLCVSHDAGATWTVEDEGLHAPHCSAVAFAGDDILVSASVDPFSAEGAVYRRPVAERGRLQPVGGLPRWLDGKCDTNCIDARESWVALADQAGNVYVSEDAGRTWSCRATGRAGPSAIAIV
jgi:photosystem II stability/assembly factor-like uncharacterized protein